MDEVTFQTCQFLLQSQSAQAAKSNAKEYSQETFSSSVLARLFPLLICFSGISDYTLQQELVASVVELTHSNQIVKDACFVYSIAISSLLSNEKDPMKRTKNAIDRVFGVLKKG